jgi:hypothetical protein
MFMDGRKAARPLPHNLIIMEVNEGEEGKEVKEVKEETQRNRLASGAMEKMCYDANHRIGMER